MFESCVCEARHASAAPRFAIGILLPTLLAAALGAQTQGSVGLGFGTLRFTDRSTLTAPSISPLLEFDSPNVTASAGGLLASAPSGNWSSQGRVDLWMATGPALGGVRLALQTTAAGTTEFNGIWTAAAHGLAEALWVAPLWGVAVGAGPSGGWIAHAPSVSALHTRARAWRRFGTATGAVSVEPTRFLGAWFTDVTGSLTLTRPRATAALWGTARISAAYGSKQGGGISLQLFPAASVAIELGAGAYLPDPYQGLPRASYLTAGVRLFASRRADVAPPPPLPASPVWPVLRPERRGDSVVVRFAMAGAATVAIAGDWGNWQPQPLRSTDGTIWTGALALPRGTYHFNLLVDGRSWVVPGGVAIITDALGGMAGVLVVD